MATGEAKAPVPLRASAASPGRGNIRVFPVSWQHGCFSELPPLGTIYISVLICCAVHSGIFHATRMTILFGLIWIELTGAEAQVLKPCGSILIG